MPLPAPVRVTPDDQHGSLRSKLGWLLFAIWMLVVPLNSWSSAGQVSAASESALPASPVSAGTTSPPSGTAQFKPRQQSGEIQLLPGPSPMHEGKILPLLYSGGPGQADQSITTGELWSFFHRQGLDKVESIVLFLDVNKFDEPDSITIKSIEFRIEPATTTQPITTCALSDTEPLVIPGYDSLSNLPEARLEIPLEYDFMQRFSAASRERVFLKIAYDAPEGSVPSFFVAGQQGWITLPSFTLLLGFIGFWGVLFFALARLTLSPTPVTASDERVS